MVVIGFLLALVFLIPTFGGSFGIYFVFLVIRKYLINSELHHRANTQEAVRDLRNTLSRPQSDQTAPSWSLKKGEVEIFFEVLVKACARRGVPHTYLLGVIEQPECRQMLMTLVASMERQGSSFLQQQSAAADFVESAWRRLPHSNGDRASNERQMLEA